jgi:hypothetical protein
LAKLADACGSDDGLSNDNMRKILCNTSTNVYYGMLCLVVCCYQSGVSDCSKIAGENNATGVGTNGRSPWDTGSHIGRIRANNANGVPHKVKRTFNVTYEGVLRSKKHIIKAWEKMYAELTAFANKPFWTDEKINTTFDDLQIIIESEAGSLRAEKQKWTEETERNKRLYELKWPFILYMESLVEGTKPSLHNFLTTMMSIEGYCFCKAYLAWVSTGIYNLRRRHMAKLPIPKWIGGHKAKAEKPSIENTLHGAPSKQLFRAIEHLINLEWPRTQSILNSSQKNFYPLHGILVVTVKVTIILGV